MNATTQGFTYAKWYAENKDKLSQKRKERYANDPEYRLRSKEASLAYRLKSPKRKSTRKDYLDIPSFCELSGISPHTYRKYQCLGWIPILHHRITFTKAHLQDLSNLAIAARNSKYMKKGRLEVLEPYIQKVKGTWLTDFPKEDALTA